MNTPWNAKLGFFSWLFLVALCSWPLSAIGFSDTVSFIGGIVLSTIVIGFAEEVNRKARIKEMRESHR